MKSCHLVNVILRKLPIYRVLRKFEDIAIFLITSQKIITQSQKSTHLNPFLMSVCTV